MFLSCRVIAWTDSTEINKSKCSNPEYFNDARKYFTCEVDWSFDACSVLFMSPPAIAGAAVFASNQNNHRKNAEEKITTTHTKYTSLREKYLELKMAGSAAEAESLYENKIRPIQESWGIFTERKRNTSVTAAYKALINKESELIKLTAKNATEEELGKARAEIANAQSELKTEINRNFSSKLTTESKKAKSITGFISGAITGLALQKIPPYAANFFNSKTCRIMEGKEELRNHLQIEKKSGECVVYLNTHDEFRLLAKSPKERAALFEKYPILCAAFIEKNETRLARINKMNIKSEILECTANNKAKASVEINNRKYIYTIEKTDGGLKISSPIGVENPNEKTIDKPVLVNWTYSTSNDAYVIESISSDQFGSKFVFSDILENRDLVSLQQSYADLNGRFNPVSRMSATGPYSIHATNERDLAGTVSEQSFALKRALPDIIQQCSNQALLQTEKAKATGTH